jgi:tRNA dimethylallyltransferase
VTDSERVAPTRPLVLALVGPTGAGKTALGIELAERFGAEIVNADSRQVYRRLDIGSAKPAPAQQARVRHHVVDVVEPDEPFDCARYRILARAAIADIVGRGKRVLLVGGTGLYVKVLLHGVFAGPSRDAALRARLAGIEATWPGALHRRLCAVDPATAARVHPHDQVRLVRALEIHELTGQPISRWRAAHAFAERSFTTCVLALDVPRVTLYRHIDERCQAMIDSGLLAEVRALLAAGLDPEVPALQSPGYREMCEHLNGACDLPTAVARMARATRRLAKRQLTWFRSDPEVVWCAPDLRTLAERAAAFWTAAK